MGERHSFGFFISGGFPKEVYQVLKELVVQYDVTQLQVLIAALAWLHQGVRDDPVEVNQLIKRVRHEYPVPPR